MSSDADKERSGSTSNTADDGIDLHLSKEMPEGKKDNTNGNETVTYINRSFDETSDPEDAQRNQDTYHTQDDVDFIKKDLSDLQDVELREDGYSGALPDPIDLVLQEIGEQASDDGAGERRNSKKLQFSVDTRGKNENDKAKEESCSNPIFRFKVWDTIFLFWNTVAMGWVYGQMGPALPDLQLIAGVPLQQATWLFTGFAIGYLGGCLLAGFIQDRFNPRLMLFLYTLGTAITIGMLPWIPVFIVMVIIRVVNGVCIGGQDTGIHSMLFALWARDGGPFIQMTHVLNALGGILAPLVTQPFVREPKDDLSTARNLSYDITNTTVSKVSDNITTTPGNFTISGLSTGGVTYPDVTAEDTKVQYAFLITGILVFSAAIPFLVAFLRKQAVKKTTRQYSNESVDKNKLPKLIKQIILCILFVNSFVATAYIDLFPSFLTTFVMIQINWTQQAALGLFRFICSGQLHWCLHFSIYYANKTYRDVLCYVRNIDTRCFTERFVCTDGTGLGNNSTQRYNDVWNIANTFHVDTGTCDTDHREDSFRSTYFRFRRSNGKSTVAWIHDGRILTNVVYIFISGRDCSLFTAICNSLYLV